MSAQMRIFMTALLPRTRCAATYLVPTPVSVRRASPGMPRAAVLVSRTRMVDISVSQTHLAREVKVSSFCVPGRM